MSDQQPLPDLPVTFRPARTRAVLLTAAAAIFVVIVTVTMLLEQLNPGERISFVFTAALLSGVLLMLARPKVVADESGVTVVNIAGRRRLEWPEILQVNLRPGDPGCSSTSATAPACPRSASSRASPSSTPSPTRALRAWSRPVPSRTSSGPPGETQG